VIAPVLIFQCGHTESVVTHVLLTVFGLASVIECRRLSLSSSAAEAGSFWN
jgi:hypothetical protein